MINRPLSNKLHIVSFNIPYPADYGGVIDVFYRMKALAEMGVEITLHCYAYGRQEATQLESYCKKVYYYRRDMSFVNMLSRKPFIVASRENKALLDNLRKDREPVLLEGLHCCSLLGQLESRKVFVRMHNVEQDYYNSLAEAETNPFKRAYYRMDARKLQRFEPVILKADAVFAVTDSDADHFRSLGCEKVYTMPISHTCDEVVCKTGQGSYALYHADLSVTENVDAVKYLVNNVFTQSKHRFVVAGRNPVQAVRELLAKTGNVELIANPDDRTMQELVANAQVNILFTNQATGLKIKLLNSLYAGRHCLVNSKMVAGTQLGKLCTVADTAEAMRAALDGLMAKPFTKQDIEFRTPILISGYSNRANAKILLDSLQQDK